MRKPSGAKTGGLTPREWAFLKVSNLLVGGTGVVFAAFRYLVENPDPYAVVNHPLEPHVQHAHVVFAPLLVFAIGLMWRPHVVRRYKRPDEPVRESGVVLAAFVIPMVLSGYLLQVASGETWRTIWAALHTVTGLLWVGAFALHELGARRSKASEAHRA